MVHPQVLPSYGKHLFLLLIASSVFRPCVCLDISSAWRGSTWQRGNADKAVKKYKLWLDWEKYPSDLS